MVGHKKKFVWVRYLFATFLLLFMVFPYLYMVLHSFAEWSQVDREWIPTQFTWKSYEWLLTGGEFATPQPWIRAFVNSLIVTCGSTLLILVFGIMAAYALAKIPFKGRGFLNNAVLFHMFFPAIILLIPQFLIIQKAGLYDTYWAMILPKALSLWAIFMLTNFFKAIPDPFIEAAKLDGANHLQILLHVILPMSKSIFVVVFLFVFMERWTELLWDMIVVRDQNLFTLNVLLSQMFGPYGGYPGPLYASAVLLTVPIIVLFLSFSAKFKDGMQFHLK